MCVCEKKKRMQERKETNHDGGAVHRKVTSNLTRLKRTIEGETAKEIMSEGTTWCLCRASNQFKHTWSTMENRVHEPYHAVRDPVQALEQCNG